MTDTTYRTVTPYLCVPDAQAELDFLQTALDVVDKGIARGDDGVIMHAEVLVGDTLVMLGQSNAQHPPKTAALYLWVEDVDATYRRMLAAGARSEAEPEDKPYGHRNAGVIDRNDVTWWVGAPVRKPA